jgi:pteridine reductase
MELDGAVAVVTGGARRLGAAIGLALARAGCNLVINYRSSQADAEATVAAARVAGARAIAVRGDMSCATDAADLLRSTLDAFGHADVLVANAGALKRTPLDTLTETDWDDMLRDNLRTAFFSAQHFGLYMRDHGGGAIVTLADIAGERPWADYLPYSVAKAGVIALTRGLAKALNDYITGVLFPVDGGRSLR